MIEVIIFTLLVSFSSYAEVSIQRLNEIRKQVQVVQNLDLDSVFEIQHDLNFPGPAASKRISVGYYVMKVNPKIMYALSPAAQKIIFYHELGHYFLGHLDQTYLDNRDFQRKIELEADVFSAFLYKEKQLISSDLVEFIEFIRRNNNSWPTGAERAAIYETILLQK